jgi:hypothetical protein
VYVPIFSWHLLTSTMCWCANYELFCPLFLYNDEVDSRIFTPVHQDYTELCIYCHCFCERRLRLLGDSPLARCGSFHECNLLSCSERVAIHRMTLILQFCAVRFCDTWNLNVRLGHVQDSYKLGWQDTNWCCQTEQPGWSIKAFGEERLLVNALYG